MLNQNPEKRKGKKVLLDVISSLLIITVLITIISSLGINLPLGIFAGPLLWLIFLIYNFKFAKLTKKYFYIVLFFLFVVGFIFNYMALDIGTQVLVESGNLGSILLGEETSEISLPTSYYIYSILGTVLILISVISMIIFYFKYYRKYLTGEKTLQELGVQGAENEQEFTRRWKEKEKKEDKIGWIIVAILIIVLLGVMIAMALA